MSVDPFLVVHGLSLRLQPKGNLSGRRFGEQDSHVPGKPYRKLQALSHETSRLGFLLCGSELRFWVVLGLFLCSDISTTSPGQVLQDFRRVIRLSVRRVGMISQVPVRDGTVRVRVEKCPKACQLTFGFLQGLSPTGPMPRGLRPRASM